MLIEILAILSFIAIAIFSTNLDKFLKNNKEQKSQLSDLRISKIRKRFPNVRITGNYDGNYALVYREIAEDKWVYEFSSNLNYVRSESQKKNKLGIPSDYCQFIGTEPTGGGSYPHTSMSELQYLPDKEAIKKEAQLSKSQHDKEELEAGLAECKNLAPAIFNQSSAPQEIIDDLLWVTEFKYIPTITLKDIHAKCSKHSEYEDEWAEIILAELENRSQRYSNK